MQMKIGFMGLVRSLAPLFCLNHLHLMCTETDAGTSGVMSSVYRKPLCLHGVGGGDQESRHCRTLGGKHAIGADANAC